MVELATTIDEIVIIGNKILGILSVISLLCLLTWFYRAYKNLKQSHMIMDTSAGFFICSFFIPLVNFFYPLRRIQELRKKMQI
jgi:Domain of unknown function (DUF4328)